MLYFESGDKNNGLYYQLFEQYPESADRFLRLFFSGKLNIMDALETVFTETNFNQQVYDKYMMVFTLADETPDRLTFQQVMPYFFALQVNYHNAIGETDGRIENVWLAGRVGNTCHWNFREYTGYNTLRNFSIEYVTVKTKFNFLLNEIYLEIPIVQVEKGLFNTNFRKKNIGFMFNPVMESPGYFIIENNHTLVKYKLPKSTYMALFNNALTKEGSYLFSQKEDLSQYIDKNNHTTVQQMLYDVGFFAVCHFNSEGNEFGLDNSNAMLLMRAREPVQLLPEETSAEWTELREHLYGLVYKHKFYVTYLYGSEIYIMCN